MGRDREKKKASSSGSRSKTSIAGDHSLVDALLKTTSQGNSNSAYIGLNLNDKAADSKDVGVQEVAPMGRDREKKKASSSGFRSKTSIAGDHSLVDAFLSKFTMAATSFFAEERILL
nr:hypothetical protein [Tanacetum cinerariifolium]